jgi:hypothetical protein
VTERDSARPGSTLRLGLLALLLATVGCGTPGPDARSAAGGLAPRPSAASPDAAATAEPLPVGPGLSIRYGISAARPRTDFELVVPPAGDAVLVLAAALSDPPHGPLGRFRGPIATELRSKLERLVRERQLMDEPPGENATAEGSGSITLATAERRVSLGLASASPALSELRAVLDSIVNELVHHPVAAVDVTLRAERGQGGLEAVAELVHVGSEPLELVMLEGDLVAGVVASVRGPDGRSHQVTLARTDLEAQANAGLFRAGITTLEPGGLILLSLPGTWPEGARVSLMVSCWLPGPGRARRSITLHTEAELHAPAP